MPFNYSIETEQSLVKVDLYGKMNISDALNTLHAFTSDTLYQHHFGIIFDVRKTNYFPRYSEVYSFYQDYQNTYQEKIRGKIAMIVNSKIQYGIARMSSTILSGSNLNMEVFLSKEEAIQWLML